MSTVSQQFLVHGLWLSSAGWPSHAQSRPASRSQIHRKQWGAHSREGPRAEWVLGVPQHQVFTQRKSSHKKHCSRKDEILRFKRPKRSNEYISPGVRTGAKSIRHRLAQGRAFSLDPNVSATVPKRVPMEDGRALQMHVRKPQNRC